MENYTIGGSAAMQGSYGKVAQPTVTPVKIVDNELGQSSVKLTDKTLTTNQQAQQNQEQQRVNKKYEEIIKDEKKMDSITETLNKFMTQINADIRFALHKETNFLMVKFVDVKNNKVLKEFPAEEYLDMIANIREYIGTMIDEKV